MEEVGVVSARVTRAQVVDFRVVYTLEVCTAEDYSWFVEIRYSDMELLASNLQSRHHFALPPLPRKRMFSSCSDEAMQERTTAFNDVLKILVTCHVQIPMVRDFLQVEAGHALQQKTKSTAESISVMLRATISASHSPPRPELSPGEASESPPAPQLTPGEASGSPGLQLPSGEAPESPPGPLLRGAPCASCGSVGVGEQQCTACTLGVFYCGTACQKADWPTHKSECKAHRPPKLSEKAQQ